MIRLAEKLLILRACDDLALFRLTSPHRRICQFYVPLSDVRLEILTADHGKLTYSSAAPVVTLVRGRQKVSFTDQGLVTITNGPRAGINVHPSVLQDSEEALPTQHCMALELADEADKCPKSIGKRILHMGTRQTIPLTDIPAWQTLHITRSPEHLKPLISVKLAKLLGIDPASSYEEYLKAFSAKIATIGYKSAIEGYVVPADYVATGGFIVMPETSMCGRGVLDYVYSMPLTQFKQQLQQRKYNIRTV